MGWLRGLVQHLLPLPPATFHNDEITSAPLALRPAPLSSPSTMSSTPSGNKSTSTPLSELSQLNLGTHQDGVFEDLPINSVEPIGDSPDTPAEQDNADELNLVIVSSSNRRRSEPDTVDNVPPARSVRQHVEVQPVFQDLPKGHRWQIYEKDFIETGKNYPIGGGKVMIFGERRVPCQKIGGHPLGIDPNGSEGGWIWVPIYKNMDYHDVMSILTVNHFSEKRANSTRKPVGWWDRVEDDDNTNLEWLEETGCRIKERGGVFELIGGKMKGKQFSKQKEQLQSYEFYVGDEHGSKTDEHGNEIGWPYGNDVNKWDDDEFPLYIHHKQGRLFHGADGGRNDAEKILCMTSKAIKNRRKALLVMNHFYLLNQQLNPPSANKFALEAPHWLNLRDKLGDASLRSIFNNGESAEILWQQIVSGNIHGDYQGGK